MSGRLPERGRRKIEMIDERKMTKQPPPAPTASAVGPCPTIIQISRMPRHRKFTQHHRTTRTTPGHRNLRLGKVGKGWLVDFRFNGPLRQYFSLYRAVSQREGEKRRERIESKNVQITPLRTYCKRNRALPYYGPNCRTPRHWIWLVVLG